MAEAEEVASDASLAESQRSGRTFALPVQISVRLDRLAKRVKGEGPIHRHEMLSALILAASDDPTVLKEQIRHYRSARIKDAEMSDAAVTAEVIRLVRNPRGPRPRSQAR